MQFYEVLVATMQYHGSEALTYGWDGEIAIGSIVRVSLRNRTVLGIVVKKVTKPSFSVKPMKSVASDVPLPSEALGLLDWLRDYYPAPLGAVVRLFVPPSDVPPKRAPTTLDGATRKISALPRLTTEQQRAIDTMQSPGSFLLHGITGSGKSRVYVELARQAIETGKSAMVLTPEIGLTAQLTETFEAVFPGRVFVLHSAQTAAERRDIWYQILEASGPVVVIGPRSALFAPLRRLGLVVLDEAHDSAYKNESAPHYQASRVAAKLAQLHGAIFVSGSATPSVEDYYLAEHKERPITAMHELAIPSSSKLAIELVDQREHDQFSRSRILSSPLLAHITQALAAGEQSLLFLNRRGTANVVLCSNCGWQSLCPNCDLALTYHSDEHRLRCHACGFNVQLPTACPECGNDEILYKSIGTKAVLSEVERLFPQAQVVRFDTDLKKTERLEQQLESLKAGKADIIVGTQMIGKGLDLPKLSLVGVINADSSLLIPDFTAAERTYQLISQVAGRVGRGHRAGTVVVQTYEPANQTLHAALHRDWGDFYARELTERQRYKFPPFTYLLKLQVLRASSKSAEAAAAKLTGELRAAYPGLIVDGPAPSFHPRERGKYSWQLLIKSPRRSVLTGIISGLPSGWGYDIDPINLL